MFSAIPSDPYPWLALDYGEGVEVSVEKVVIYNRPAIGARTRNIEVQISDELPALATSKFTSGQLLGTFTGPASDGQVIEIQSGPGWLSKHGRYLIVQMDNGKDPLNLKEVVASGVHFPDGQ